MNLLSGLGLGTVPPSRLRLIGVVVESSSDERVNLKSVHVFKGGELGNTEFDYRRRTNNGGKMPRQQVLIFSPFFSSKTAHLVCQADVESKGFVVVCAIPKDFRSHSIAQHTKFQLFVRIHRYELQPARPLRGQCLFLVQAEAYRQLSVHPESRDPFADDAVAFCYRCADRNA